MSRFGLKLVHLGLLASWAAVAGAGDSNPRSHDARIRITQFAAAPDIVQPVGCAFDAKGRLLVIESHTHFRPKEYRGPKHDRVRIFEDSNGDGRADRITTFHEGVDAAMGIAVALDGGVILATRSSVLRLVDRDGDGLADECKVLLRLETKADYPHNGLSGLALDANGDLLVGMGENMGETYRLVAADGSLYQGGGEGGNIFRCTAAGGKLCRVAIGFWNPFGICHDRGGHIFAVDNDPDASPPCRMLHVVEGGDYGYQYRYGRTGKHPFQSWNGELPGTLPQMAATGEAPCQILEYTGANLPADYVGDMLVAAWADHRIERYRIQRRGVSYGAERLPFVSATGDFRPVGIAVAPDGSLYITDWVSKDYHLHGRGAIWHVRGTGPANSAKGTARPAPHKPRVATDDDVAANLKSEDAFVRCEAVRQLTLRMPLLESLRKRHISDRWMRIGLLLAMRTLGDSRDVPKFLEDEDGDVRLLAAKWIADDRLAQFRPNLESLWNRRIHDVRTALALATALARIDGREVRESDMADYFYTRFSDATSQMAARAAALQAIPAQYSKLQAAALLDLLDNSPEQLALEAVRFAGDSPKNELAVAVLQSALRKDRPSLVRAQAVVGLQRFSNADALVELLSDGDAAVKSEALRGLFGRATTDLQKTHIAEATSGDRQLEPLARRVLGRSLTSRRPSPDDIESWLKLLEGPADPAAGRRVFAGAKPAGCAKCHRIDGRGELVGPDLSTVGRNDRRAILESLLQPSAKIAPSYRSWQLVMNDGKVRTGILVHTVYDECTYVDSNGDRFKVVGKDVETSRPAETSIMPNGLVDLLTDQELRDLLAYLCSRK